LVAAAEAAAHLTMMDVAAAVVPVPLGVEHLQSLQVIHMP
jgi:hypothetical protein